MKTRKSAGFAIALLLFLLCISPAKVWAVGRQATISAPAGAEIGQTFSVTLGFSPRANTRSCNFTIEYDNSLLQFAGSSNISGLDGSVSTGNTSPLTAVLLYMGEAQPADKIISLKFKALAGGVATIKITSASDGEESNTVSVGASSSINLTAPPAPTTAATTAATTTKATTTAATTTTTTAPTTTEETLPHHQVETIIGQRYDGVSLVVPDSVPVAEAVPATFKETEVKWRDKYLLGYRSESLPYVLYWLSDGTGGTGFYLYEETSGVFVPYMRTEWSSRFYTFSVLPEAQVPEGFELVTLKVWERLVPGYRPLEDHYLTKDNYDRLREEDGELGGNGLPPTAFLLALRLNDQEKVGLYLYDQGIDSLIRADHWLVPLAGSFLDPDYNRPEPEPEPSETAPPETEETTTAPSDQPAGLAKMVNLFGVDMPFYLVAGAGFLILLMLILAVCFLVRAKKAARHSLLSDQEAGEEEEVESGLNPGGMEEGLPAPLVTGYDEEEKKEEEDPSASALSSDNGWEELKETLFGREKEKSRRQDKRPPGIRPSIQRRTGRDDPEDIEEL